MALPSSRFVRLCFIVGFGLVGLGGCVLVAGLAVGSRTTAGRSLWISLPGLVIAFVPMLASIVVGALERNHGGDDDS